MELVEMPNASLPVGADWKEMSPPMSDTGWDEFELFSGTPILDFHRSNNKWEDENHLSVQDPHYKQKVVASRQRQAAKILFGDRQKRSEPPSQYLMEIERVEAREKWKKANSFVEICKLIFSSFGIADEMATLLSKTIYEYTWEAFMDESFRNENKHVYRHSIHMYSEHKKNTTKPTDVELFLAMMENDLHKTDVTKKVSESEVLVLKVMCQKCKKFHKVSDIPRKSYDETFICKACETENMKKDIRAGKIPMHTWHTAKRLLLSSILCGGVQILYLAWKKDWALCSLGLAGTIASVNHWRKPYHDSFRRKMDVLLVFVNFNAWVYRAVRLELVLIYLCSLIPGLLCFVYAVRLLQDLQRSKSSLAHAAFHVCVTIANLWLFYNISPTKTCYT